jgi:hypothetical protein
VTCANLADARFHFGVGDVAAIPCDKEIHPMHCGNGDVRRVDPRHRGHGTFAQEGCRKFLRTG